MKRLILSSLTAALLATACASAAADPTPSSSAVPPATTALHAAATAPAPPETTQSPPDPYAGLVDDWLSDHDVVGAVVLVVAPDGSGDAAGYGFNDRQAQTPTVATDLFRIGSITKVYTAALVMTLVEDGVLDLQDSASEYIPNLPEDITVAQLLSHTSGLRDVDVAAGIFEAIEAGGLAENSRDAVSEALGRGLVFEPGARQSYSSVGYLAIERVIEGVTGVTWDVALAERVLPENSGTRLEDDATPLPTPYERLGPASPAISLASLPTSQFARGAGAAGGLVASAFDVGQFIRALFSGAIVSEASLTEMTDVTSPRREYGLGLAFYAIDNHPIYGHNGRTIGFASSVRHDPASNITVVVLSNDGAAPTDKLANLLMLSALSDR